MTQQTITPQKALVFHSIDMPSLDALHDEDNQPYQSSGLQMALTVHDIKQSPTGAVITAGRVFSEADKQELRDYLNGEDGIKAEWLPSNLMLINSHKMVWYVPSKLRTMHIKVGDKVQHIKLKWPSLVFQADSNGRLKIAAYAGSGRPSLTQPLYHAPLWNIYADTRLCSGSATTTNIISVKSMKVWEEAVFDTLFTHSNHQRVLPNTATGKQRSYLPFIKNKAKTGASFRACDMTPLKMTLEQWA